MTTVYFRKAGAFQGERAVDTLPVFATEEEQEALAARAAWIDANFGRPDSDSKPSAV